MEETTVADRVMNLIKSENLSASSFADKIKVQRSAISHISKGRNEPSLQLIKKIIQAFPHVNVEWLFMGFGNMYKDGTSGNKPVDETETPLPDSVNEPVDSAASLDEEIADPEPETMAETSTKKEPSARMETKSSIRSTPRESEPEDERPVNRAVTVNSTPQGLFTNNGELILFDPRDKTYTIYKQAQ